MLIPAIQDEPRRSLARDRQYRMTMPRFGRALTAQELPGYREAVREGLRVLGKDRLVVIAHPTCFPSEQGKDPGAGSHYASGAKPFVTFLQDTLGATGIQLGPWGMTKKGNPCPYQSTLYSNNPYHVALQEMAENPYWCGILPPQRVQQIYQANPHPNGTRMHYPHVETQYSAALTDAYQNYTTLLKSANPPNELQALRADFDAFKSQAGPEWLERDALYAALTAEHDNDYFPNWLKKGMPEQAQKEAQLDQRLMCPKSEDKTAAETRKQALGQKHADLMEQYRFTQFILDQQNKTMRAFLKERRFAYYADHQVGIDGPEAWEHQDLFLPNWRMGAPGDGFDPKGQGWDKPFLDPNKIVNADGSLGPGGQFIYKTFRRIFRQNPGGVRIDHVVGWIDRWAYPPGQLPADGSRLYSSPGHPKLGQYAYIGSDQINTTQPAGHEERVKAKTLTEKQVKQYAALMQIILNAAQDEGLDKTALICEDLGTVTNPVQAVMKHLELGGLRVTQFNDTPLNPNHIYRGKNARPEDWIASGTHDNPPLRLWSESLKLTGRLAHARQLCQDLKLSLRPPKIKKLATDQRRFVTAKLAELFASPARFVQIPFQDVLGIPERYNTPGKTMEQDGVDNWTLRVGNHYQEEYFKRVARGEALNMPEVLRMALRARELHKQQADLVHRLKDYEAILKAPSAN